MNYKLGMLAILTSITSLTGTDSNCYAAPNLPILQQSNLVYKGAFRVPKGKYGASTKSFSLSYGGNSLAFNPKNNSLFMLGHLDSEKMLLEMSIPAVVNGTTLSSLNTASVIQGSVDITGGIGYDKLGAGNTAIPNGGRPGSLLVYDNKLIGNSWAYYDGTSKAMNSHFTANLDWSAGPGFSGFYSVGVNPENTASANGGFVGGYMAPIPTEWQADFGGTALTGLGGTPVITRSSFGPSVSVFDPANVGVADPVPATMLVGYPSSHRTLGNYTDGNLIYNSTTEVRGVVFPSGTSTVLFFGRHGLGADNFGAGSNYSGQTTYGPATSNLNEVGRTATSVPNTCGSAVIAGGDTCNYDPADSSKGVHGFPYVYRVWAYNAADIALVNNGAVNPSTGQRFQPWDLIPYGVWDLPLPFSISQARINSATYDPSTQRIYLAQEAADKPNLEPFPVIHVFEVQNAELPDSTPPSVFITSPSDALPVTGNLAVKATATDNVGVTRVDYYLNNGSTGVLIGSNSSAPFGLNWDTTTVADGSYTIHAEAFDHAGNLGRSPNLVVTVNNSVVTKFALDTTAPKVTGFAMSAVATSKTVSITSFSASDNVAVVGYLVGETSSVPSLSAAGWSATPPSSFTFSSTGVKTAYAWAKDAAGNLSNGLSVSVNVTVPDTTIPQLTAFTLPTSATTLVVPVATLSASDNVGVTGYLITESSAPPLVNASGWSTSAPVSFTFAGFGSRTAYAWAKDAAGNLSASRAATVNIIDATAPAVNSFTMPVTSATLSVPVAALSATDNLAVTGYLISESSVAPLATASGWTSTAPVSFSFSGYGTRTAYAWAKDAAGNVSAALAAAVTITDTIAPTVNSFSIPATSTTLIVPVSSFTASDNLAVTGYLVTESSKVPAANASWTSTPNGRFTFTIAGAHTLYGWAKDAAGNVSTGRSASVTITLGDTIAPKVSNFSLPASSTSLTAAVSSFSATDNVGVTGYQITESATAPAASASGWTASAPTSFTFAGNGNRTAYAWAKDAAGNVSTSSVSSVLVDTSLPVIGTVSLVNGKSTVTIKASSTDNVAVAKMQVYVDSILQMESATNSISDLWALTYKGAHTVVVKAYDTVGNVRAQTLSFNM